MCLPSDALLQHLPSYLGFSYLGCAVSLHGCSSKAQTLLLTFDTGDLLTAALPDLQRGRDPLGPPAPVQPLLLTLDKGYLLTAALPDLQRGRDPLGPLAPMRLPLLGRGVARRFKQKDIPCSCLEEKIFFKCHFSKKWSIDSLHPRGIS